MEKAATIKENRECRRL